MDLISRQAAIDAITAIDDGFNCDIYTNEVREILRELPSVQPVAKDINVPVSDCISRQAAIDAIDEWIKAFRENGHRESAADARFIQDGIIQLPSVQEQRWIPVTERLPEEVNKSYWVCTDYGSQVECRWTNVNRFWADHTTDWHWNICDIPQFSSVVAWMPLPEPYKEGE